MLIGLPYKKKVHKVFNAEPRLTSFHIPLTPTPQWTAWHTAGTKVSPR